MQAAPFVRSPPAPPKLRPQPPTRVIQLLLITFNTPSTNVVRLLQGVGSQFLFCFIIIFFFAPSLTFCPNIDFQVQDPQAFANASPCKLNEVLKHFVRDCTGCGHNAMQSSVTNLDREIIFA